MRLIPSEKIATAVENLMIRANRNLDPVVLNRIREARRRESSPLARKFLDDIIENARIAANEGLPLCQDTGLAVFYIRIGAKIAEEDGSLEQAVYEGVRRGTERGYLRSSVVRDPLRRGNTGDNTPPIIHLEIVPEDTLEITYTARGGGSDNMSVLELLSPLAGREGIKDFVLRAVQKAGGKPCPPLLVGVGLGGSPEMAVMLAARAILRKELAPHPDSFYAALEQEILDAVNATGIGPMGLGGDTTAIGIFIETHPCHIGSLPAAVHLGCHSVRWGTILL